MLVSHLRDIIGLSTMCCPRQVKSGVLRWAWSFRRGIDKEVHAEEA